MTIRSANAIPENERFAPFFKGDGEMPELIRKYDWTGSPLGPLSQWPNGLNTILGLMLHTKFPMFLFWGPELICFYNDPFRPSLGIDGKHPAIGKKGKEVWAEIWEFIGPLIDQVMTRGIPVFFEDQLVPFYRNGKIEDIYWTFSYSPAYGENGQINGVVVICTETTPQVNLLKDIRDGKEQLDFAIDAAELGTWDLDPATNRFVGNDRLKEWFGLEPQDEIKLSRALDNIVERDRERVLKTITESLAPGSEGRYDIEYSLLAPGTKEERKVIARGKAFFDEKGVAYRFSGTLQDVTAERRTRELADANYRLQQSNIELNQFAYVASHDLQEPLRKVSTFTELLEMNLENISSKAKSYLDKIRVSTGRMQTLIKDLLRFSILSNEMEKFERVDLNAIFGAIIVDYELSIEREGANIQVNELPVIDAIPFQMRQLFANLVSNAMKFRSPDRALEILVTSGIVEDPEILKRYKLDRRKTYYRITVKDNGIGFSQENARQIFYLFQRLHGKTEYEGTGIGLAICYKILQNHRGAIYAEATLGAGALFTILIPAIQQK